MTCYHNTYAVGGVNSDEPDDSYGEPTLEDQNEGRRVTHGTQVAGEITAMTESTGAADESAGIAGVAPSILVLPIRLETVEWTDNDGWHYQYDDISIIKAVHALAKELRHGWWSDKVRVVNMSFGGKRINDEAGPIELAIRTDVQENDRLYVASAGNNAAQGLYFPAAYPCWVLGVTGLIWDYNPPGPAEPDWTTTWYLEVNKGSNYMNDGFQTYPVSGIYGVINYETINPTRSTTTGVGPNPDPETYYGNFKGTSACAPQIAGLAALLYTKHPSAHYYEVRNHLIATRDNTTNQYGDHQLAGLVDFDMALYTWGEE